MKHRTRWKLGAAAFLSVLLLLVYGLRGTLLPMFLAFGLAYAFSPVVDALERRGLSRSWGVAAVLAALAASIALLVGTVVPIVVVEMQGFTKDLPDLLPQAVRRVSDFAAGFGIVVPASVDGIVARLREAGGNTSMDALNPVVNAAKHVFASLAGILIFSLNLIIVPIFFFYVCRDFHKSRQYVFSLVPPRSRPYARSLYERVDEVLSGYIRGQLLVASILGVVFAIGLALLGIRFGIFIGLLGGFLNIVPYLGQITGLGLALLMAFVDFQGFGQIFAILALFGVMNFIEGNFITPRIVGNKVGLSPLWAILALIVGGSSGGLVGMILAVPVAGVIKVVLTDLIEKYKESEFYQDENSLRRKADAP